MKKIAIIGGGLFGITSYLILRSLGYNCILFEKNKEIMMGASTNNLNRVHYGYHYPRDNQTAKQSYAGHKSFASFYKDSIIKNFSSYYLIAKNKSLINFSNYLKFCKKNKLPYKFVDNKNFITKTNGIEGIIKVNEPVYSWSLIKKIIAKKLASIEDNMIFTEEEVIKVSKIKKHFLIKTTKNTYTCEYIIDASYMSLKCFIKKNCLSNSNNSRNCHPKFKKKNRNSNYGWTFFFFFAQRKRKNLFIISCKPFYSKI